MSVRLHIVHQSAHTSIVKPWGFNLECDYEFDPGEAPIYYPTDSAHPGSPPNAELIACRVNGIDITDMLTLDQRERLEEALIAKMEGF